MIIWGEMNNMHSERFIWRQNEQNTFLNAVYGGKMNNMHSRTSNVLANEQFAL